MSTVFFISDLHFSHHRVIEFKDRWRAKVLGVNTIEEHDETLIRRVNQYVTKRDVLFILGDLGNHKLINEFKCQKRIHLGNHDKEKFTEYAKLENTEIISCVPYKKHWVVHIPIIQKELFNKNCIHGHVHSDSIRDPRYINMSVELTCGFPIPFSYIQDGKFTTYNISTPEDSKAQIVKLGLKDSSLD